MTVERSAPSVQEGAGQNKIQASALSINGAVSQCVHLDIDVLEPIVSRVRTDVTARPGTKGMIWTREALSDERLRQHLNGGTSRGCCPIQAGESTTRLALMDLDSHKGETSWDEMRQVAARVIEGLERRNFSPIPFRSRGGRGIHLYMLWDKPQEAYNVRQALKEVLLTLGLKDGTRGVSAGEIEVFPKQNSVPKDGFGNMFILPLAGKSEPLEPILDLEPAGREWIRFVEWPLSRSVPVPDEDAMGARATSVARGDDLSRAVTLSRVDDDVIEDISSAMAAFTQEDSEDYDFWTKRIGFALKSLAQAGREDEALKFWHEFSSLFSEYDYEEVQRKWDDDLHPNSVTYLSIFKWAQDRGWVNPKSAEALKANATAATRLDRTDAGNMALLANLTNSDLRYVPEINTWLCWNGQRWDRDEYGVSAQRAALQVAEHYLKKAAQLREQAARESLDGKERKNIEKAVASVEKWAAHCRNRNSLLNMLNLAKSDVRFALSMEKLDRDPWLFGVANGVVDLRTGALREASRDDYVTKSAPVAFDPSAPAPQWGKFIEEVTGEPGSAGGIRPRPALASYIQRALGYALTGSTEEQKMFIAVGGGSNGKNVMLDTLQWVMGSYCQTIAPEALMASRHDADAERPTPNARMLAGARVAISSESKEGQQLNVALVKRHTGGGYMTARALHENSFTFEITHKLWLMTNHQPRLDHMDEAVRGRLHIIPFSMRWNRPGHPERNPALPDGDKGLKDKIKAEGAGVLAWLVAGAVAYARNGLELPPEVSRTTRDYLSGQDPLGLWLNTCERCEPLRGGKASELFDAFLQWCDGEGYSADMAGAGNQTAFSKKLLARGVEGVRAKDGKRYGLKAQYFAD